MCSMRLQILEGLFGTRLSNRTWSQALLNFTLYARKFKNQGFTPIRLLGITDNNEGGLLFIAVKY